MFKNVSSLASTKPNQYHKTVQKEVHSEPNVKIFLSWIITGNENGSITFNHRQKTVEWQCLTYPWKEKFKAVLSAGSHCCCFWNAEGVIVVDIMTHGQTINSDLYTHALSKHFGTV